MNVMMLVKQGRGGSGVSLATRYIARRDRDVAREGSAPRKLFSEKEDTLGFFQANRILGNGQDPKAEDVLHLVVSLEKETDFLVLGIDEEARQRALREATRGSMKWLAENLQTNDLRWVAGVHRNTDNPHIHLLIHRDYTQRETGRPQRLKTLPKEMRVSWRRTADGTRLTHPGDLSLTFGNLLERTKENARGTGSRVMFSPDSNLATHKERIILGRALIVEDKINRLEKMRDNNLQFGDRYRYEFTNGRELRRGFSEHDIHQRGTAKATQHLSESSQTLNSEQRREVRGRIVAEEFERHEELVQKHRQTRAADLEMITIKLARAIGSSQHLIEKAKKINARSMAEYGVAPIPILPRDQLSKLQDSAIERRDVDRVKMLEEIRLAIAAENATPTRTVHEVDRLRAQLFVAQSSLASERDSANRFEETKHQLKWEFPGEPGHGTDQTSPTKKSLTEIDRSLIWELDQSKFIGAKRLHWDDDRRQLAKIRVEELNRLREGVIDRIEAKRTEYLKRVHDQAEFVATLSEIFSREEKEGQIKGADHYPPIFTREEFQDLDSVALRLRDPQFYRELIAVEHRLAAQTDLQKPISPEERASRALARACLAEIEVRESDLNLANLRERRELIDVLVNDDGKRIIEIARLADRPTAPLEKLFRPMLVPDERRAEIDTALKSYEQRLIERREKTDETHHLLLEEARIREAEFSQANPERSLPPPAFTYREMSLLELHAARETDPILKAKYETLYREALEHPYEDRSRQIVIEKSADELLDSISRSGQPDHAPASQSSSQESREIEISK